MAFTLGQHTSAQAPNATSPDLHTVAFAGNVTAGNLLIVVDADYSGTGTVSTGIANTGTAGAQTWHQAVLFQSSTDGATAGIWWAIASGTGSCTVSQTWSGTLGGEIYVAEFSGTSVAGTTQDGIGKTAQGTTGSIILPSITTTNADDLVVGYVSSANTGTVNSPWTQVDQRSGDEWFYRADLAASTYTPSVSQTSGAYMCVMAALGKVSGTTNSDAPTGQLILAGTMAESQTLNDQLLRPASDIATTGWTNTPLFSKINDSSDGTFITATLA